MEWTGVRYADGPEVEVRTRIAAPPEHVWRFVSDIELMPQLTPELRAVRWLDGDGPRVGARFRGENEHPALGTWETTSFVIECSPPSVFAWAVSDPDNPTATWKFTIEPAENGSVLSQWAHIGPAPSGLSIAIERMPDKEQKIVYKRMCEFEENMKGTLAAFKKLAEQ